MSFFSKVLYIISVKKDIQLFSEGFLKDQKENPKS